MGSRSLGTDFFYGYRFAIKGFGGCYVIAMKWGDLVEGVMNIYNVQRYDSY